MILVSLPPESKFKPQSRIIHFEKPVASSDSYNNHKKWLIDIDKNKLTSVLLIAPNAIAVCIDKKIINIDTATPRSSSGFERTEEISWGISAKGLRKTINPYKTENHFACRKGN